MALQTVAFVGLGYIGLPTAVVMANNGLDVTGVDINESLVEAINKGDVRNSEPGLLEALNTALTSGTFRASTDMVSVDAYIIAVPTPFAGNHEINLEFILSAADSIAPHLKGGELVVLESTSPPGTTRRMAERILDLRPDLAADEESVDPNGAVVYFAHCPERILPGNALEELVNNDRIIGGETKGATRLATKLYRSFCNGELLATDAPTAEMAKLTENSFRDVNIAFANELSLICDNLGIDVWELIRLANHHPRVQILQPGPGVGGHCIAVDPWFIVSADSENSRLIRTAREVNDHKPEWIIEKFEATIAQPGVRKVAVFGLAFKPGIDDLRESPALAITLKLVSKYPDLEFLAVEPNIEALPQVLSRHENVELAQWPVAAKEADALLLLVDHDEFKNPEVEMLEGKIILDAKGIWA